MGENGGKWGKMGKHFVGNLALSVHEFPHFDYMAGSTNFSVTSVFQKVFCHALTKGIEKGPDCFRDHGQKSGGVTDTDAVAEHPEEVQCLSVSFIFRKRVVAEASKMDMVVLQH